MIRVYFAMVSGARAFQVVAKSGVQLSVSPSVNDIDASVKGLSCGQVINIHRVIKCKTTRSTYGQVDSGHWVALTSSDGLTALLAPVKQDTKKANSRSLRPAHASDDLLTQYADNMYDALLSSGVTKEELEGDQYLKAYSSMGKPRASGSRSSESMSGIAGSSLRSGSDLGKLVSSLPAPEVDSDLVHTCMNGVNGIHCKKGSGSIGKGVGNGLTSAGNLGKESRDLGRGARGKLCLSEVGRLNLSDRNLVAMSVKGNSVLVGGCDHSARVLECKLGSSSKMGSSNNLGASAPGLEVSVYEKVELYSKTQGHSDWVTSVSHFKSHANNSLVSAGMDGKIILWRPSSNSGSGIAASKAGFTLGPQSRPANRTPSGPQVSSSSSSVGSYRSVELKGHVGSISEILCFDKLILSASYDRSVKIWDSEMVKQVGSCDGFTSAVTGLAAWVETAENGKVNGTKSLDASLSLAFASTRTGGLSCIDFSTMQTVSKWSAHKGQVSSIVSLAPRLVMTGGHDGCIRLFDSRQRSPAKIFEGSFLPGAAVTCSDAGRNILACAGADGKILTFDISRGLEKLSAFQSGHVGFIYSLAVSSSGDCVISGGGEGTVAVHDAYSGGSLLADSAKIDKNAVRCIGLLENETVVCATDDGSAVFLRFT